MKSDRSDSDIDVVPPGGFRIHSILRAAAGAYHASGTPAAGGIITAPDIRGAEIRQGSLEEPFSGLGFPVHGIQARAILSTPIVGYMLE